MAHGAGGSRISYRRYGLAEDVAGAGCSGRARLTRMIGRCLGVVV